MLSFQQKRESEECMPACFDMTDTPLIAAGMFIFKFGDNLFIKVFS
jgi:hypothetical protein